jgi:CubicO group peptidase (beta-lactamase class C family)
MLLNGGFYGGQRIVKPATIEFFTRRQDAFSSRAFGWDTPARGASQGDYFSANSFGHTGFTGTSIWVDKDRDLFLVLLTNRLNTSEDNQRHLALRRAVHDAVAQAISDGVIEKRPTGPGR